MVEEPTSNPDDAWSHLLTKHVRSGGRRNAEVWMGTLEAFLESGEDFVNAMSPSGEGNLL